MTLINIYSYEISTRERANSKNLPRKRAQTCISTLHQRTMINFFFYFQYSFEHTYVVGIYFVINFMNEIDNKKNKEEEKKERMYVF